MPWVTLNLKIVYQEPGKYQFRGSKAECQAYVKEAQTHYTEEQMRENERELIVQQYGESGLKDYFGEHWQSVLERNRHKRILRRKGVLKVEE